MAGVKVYYSAMNNLYDNQDEPVFKAYTPVLFVLKSDYDLQAQKIAELEAMLKVMREKLADGMRYDVANYLRGTITYSPSSIQKELDARPVKLDAEVQAAAKSVKGGV